MLARRARASLSISFSSSSRSMVSGRAGFDSGSGSSSPGLKYVRWRAINKKANLDIPQSSNIVCAGSMCLTPWATQPQFIILASLSFIQQFLVSFQTLCCCSPDNGRDRAPLSRHQLGKMEKFLILLSGPLDLANTRVQPFYPSCLALFWRLSREKR